MLLYKKNKPVTLASSIWPSIRSSINFLNRNCHWIAHKGSKLKFWLDNWLGFSLLDLVSQPSSIDLNISIANQIAHIDLLNSPIRNIIEKYQFSVDSDILIWDSSPSGIPDCKRF